LLPQLGQIQKQTSKFGIYTPKFKPKKEVKIALFLYLVLVSSQKYKHLMTINLYFLYLVKGQKFWLNLPTDDHHFGYIKKFIKTTLRFAMSFPIPKYLFFWGAWSL
jgi:hypothetical protein